MRMRTVAAAAAVSICLSAPILGASGAAPPKPPAGETATMYHAQGTFDVKLVPQGEGDAGDGSTLGRMTIEKAYHGALEGTARGEMLTAMTGVDGSAGYVAVERVTGTLDGRAGSFVLLHRGVMKRGAQELTITVVPDSGSRELHSLAGAMTIRIEDGKHFFDLEYALPEPTR